MAVLKEKEQVSRTVTPGFKRTVTSLNNLMMVVCEFTDGPAKERDKPHSHPHEQITYVVEGELFLFTDDEKHYLVKGDIYTVAPDIPHGIQTLSSYVKLIDCFSPVREDFLLIT
jgi:quercetin dioxygenase-like cupin family protein